MTEAEWFRCTEPQTMLDHLGAQASARKRRWFACHCCRRLWDLLDEEASWQVIEVVEKYADGLAGEEYMRRAAEAALQVELRVANDTESDDPFAPQFAAQAVTTAAQGGPAWEDAAGAVATLQSDPLRLQAGREWQNVDLSRRLAHEATEAYQRGLQAEQEYQAALLREMFGNPFRPVAVEAAWLAWNDGAVPKLARAIYDGSRFGDLPILADALEEAGCANADLLGHCRSDGEHVRGCWALDLLHVISSLPAP
jgi:hypothetical protein